MQITFLGTSSMVPTKDRNQIAVFVSHDSDGVLIDCGEGTQRQFKIAGISLTKVTKVLISHWHGDHVLGLPGLMQTLSSSDYNSKLEIYGPVGTKKRIEKMFEAFVFDKKLSFVVKDVKSGVFFENNKFQLGAYPLEHGVETLGFRFVEKDKRKIDLKKVNKFNIPHGPLLGKLQEGEIITLNGKKIDPDDVTYIESGKKLAYITDTVLCDSCYKIADDVDLLISEATYSSKLAGKSEAYGHMTAKQAAQLANKSNVKQLVLIHFSARYKNTQELEEDARNIFDNVICAKDFMKINL
ncbi:ribonuclease Z [Candidatus Woesearchaeota archaeon]|jgi:ribonuclease Z|nr:ribonuclease Z [Candidatus Woesearchaeota archaeon]MDP6647952.1 ribonuclease Z [Candidatus Woesearchaeota archaeon]|tara:strand:+ start:17376 stop:18266 length:891 start_codon:yes stop_codon:yes gene_type:complete